MVELRQKLRSSNHTPTLAGPAVVWGAGLSNEPHGSPKLPVVVVLNRLLIPVPGATGSAPHGALA